MTDIFDEMAGVEKPRQKQMRIARERVSGIQRTAQTILSEIMKKWCEELEKVILPAEIKMRMTNLLTSDHRNYRFFRSEFLTLIDYAIRKGVIK